MLQVSIALFILLSQLPVVPPPGGLLQAPAARQQRPVDPAVKRDGWWIRLNPQSKAEKITWRYSEPAKKGQEPATSSWTRANDPDNFDLPETVRLAGVLALTVTAEPPKTLASFCVFYAAEGVQFVEFTGSRKQTLDSRTRDKNCVP